MRVYMPVRVWATCAQTKSAYRDVLTLFCQQVRQVEATFPKTHPFIQVWYH